MERSDGRAGRAYTTREMQGYERELIKCMKQGQGTRDVLADGKVREQTMQEHSHLSMSQRDAVETVLTSRDQMMALEGVAGAEKNNLSTRERSPYVNRDSTAMAEDARVGCRHLSSAAGSAVEGITKQQSISRRVQQGLSNRIKPTLGALLAIQS